MVPYTCLHAYMLNYVCFVAIPQDEPIALPTYST